MEKELAEKFYMLMGDFRKILLNKNNLCELSKSEFSMLHHIKHCENDRGYVSTSVLSQNLHISKPATSQMINILEDKQYIKRIIDKNDRRLTHVILTDLGNEVVEKGVQILLNRLNLVFDKMGKQDSELFIELLSKYVSVFKELCNSSNFNT
ncbi:MAG: MarR family winged helix-turn-helix transcriptional regulator [Ruminiclostridium sp.]